MRVTRLFVDQELTVRDEIVLNETVRHHAVNVLRLNKHSVLILFNGDGSDYTCEILEINKKSIIVLITGRIEFNNESTLETNLFLSISKSSHMDYAIQKSVEMGVSSIQPVITERSIFTNKNLSKNQKHTHWEKIIIHACEQCGRVKLPKLFEAIKIQNINELEDKQSGFVFDARSNQTLSEFKEYDYSSVSLLVGPEGGFTESEVEFAKYLGFQAVTFGPRVLRTETAAFAAVTSAQLFWGDLTDQTL